MEATRLRCEYLVNPLGIDITRPRLFWNCLNGIKQTGFILKYSLNDGEVVSKEYDSSLMHVDFPVLLKSKDRVNWSLILKDENNEYGKESEKSYFELGLLDKLDWKANWISGDYSPIKNKRYPIDYFKKEFEVNDLSRARLYITSCGLYEAFINGIRVGDSYFTPGSTDYRKRIQYQVYDVTNLLKTGHNEIVILLSDGWYRGSIGAKGRRNVFGKQTKLLLQLEMVSSKGELTRVCSDSSFSWSNDGPLRFADLKDGEIVDFNLIPSFKNKARLSKCNTTLAASNNVLVKEHETFTPIKIIEHCPKNKVYEFSQNLAGYISLKINAKANQHLDIVMGEILDKSNHVSLSNIQCTYKRKKSPLQEIHITTKEGLNEYKSKFFYGGFRYVEVNSDLPFEIELTQIALYSSFEETSEFNCSNPLLNTFYKNTLWSLKSNSLDVPTDCPTRERMGWTGDSQLFFNTASYLVDYASFSRKHLVDVYDRQSRSGRLPQIAPYNAEDWFMNVMNGSVGWADVGILMPYYFYVRYGDERILASNYDGMIRYARFMMNRQGKWGGVYAKPLHIKHSLAKYAVNRGQSYGEWAEPIEVAKMSWLDFAEPHPEVSTAYTSFVLSIMNKIMDILNKPHDDLYNKIKFRSEMAKKAYQALVETKKYSLDTNRQANLVRPIYMNLLTKEQDEYARNRLIKALDNFGWKLGTGFLSTPFILDVLSSIDISYAYKLLENKKCPGWLFMAIHNSGTIWEGWEGTESDKGIASLNHYSKGALVEWLFRGMMGINIVNENEFLLKPLIYKDEPKGYASYQSVYGKISIGFEIKDDGVHFHVVVPPNTKARFVYKDIDRELVAGEYRFVG